MSVLARLLAATHTPIRWTRRCVRWALSLLLLGLILLLSAWAALHWAILPHIDRWRGPLEEQATRALGLKASIGQIEAEGGGIIPVLTLRDLCLTDAQGRVALRLPEIKAALSARSLLALELRFSQLYIEGPELELRRDRQGRIFVAGLDIAEGDAKRADRGAELADWFFAQPEFIIRQGRVRWVDEQRQAPPLELSGLNLVMRNGLRSHELRVDATPPKAWGERFALRGRFTQPLLKRPSELQLWSGELFADLPRADVRELRRYVELPFELSEGDGALRAWAEIRQGRPQALTLDMGLRAVRMQLSRDVEPLEFSGISGRLQLQRQAQGLVFSAQQLGFELDEQRVWPRGDWSLSLKEAGKGGSRGLAPAPGEIVGGELKIERLDLDLLASIATKLPLGLQLRQLIQDIAPQGQLSGLQASWDGSLDAPTHYKARGELKGFAMQSQPGADASHIGRPGLQGANLSLQADERGGEAQLTLNDGAVDFPGVFETPHIPLQRLEAGLSWRMTPAADPKQPPALELRASRIRLANEDLQGELEATWRTGNGGGPGRGGRLPGTLDLSGRLAEVRAAGVVRYLPLGVGETARHYVRDAVREGWARNVQIRTRGDLWDFPYDRSKDGIFRISAQVQDVLLAYVPGQPATDDSPAVPSPWPVMEQVHADLLFDRGSMSLRNARARVGGYELSGVNGGIKDLIHSAELVLDGAGRGPAAELLRFVNNSPVGGWTHQALATASANGNAQLRLHVQMPLNHVDDTQVKGTVLLQGNDLRLRPDVPLLAAARARVDFDNKGVQIAGGQARVLGGDASFEGGSQKDGSLRFLAQGTASAEGLRRASELGLASRLAQVASGQAPYRLQLGIRGGQTEITLNSSLQGLGLDLPAPLRKDADAVLPLLYQTQLQGDKAQRDELRVELGTVLAALYQRDLSGEQARVLRGSLSVQDHLPPLPGNGVALQASLGAFNADLWQQQLQRLSGTGEGEHGSVDSPYVPNQLALKVQQLSTGGRVLNHVVAGITHQPESWTWRANVDAEQLSGYLEYREPAAPQGGRVYARLARLALPRSEVDSVSQLLDKQSASVPALDIVVDDFELRGKRLGRLEMDAQLQGPRLPGGREWRLNKLQLSSPDAQLVASGQWRSEAGQAQRRTALDWTLDVNDAGKLLERLGQGQVLRGGKGQLKGTLSWLGSPLSPHFPSMGGQFSVALDAGQFLKAEPGVGRLLGVLSLQSLPRRLLLDFRDVFSQGFAFDNVGGDVRIERGVASSANLRMRGVQAVVLMDGSADLDAETQDLRVLVVPEVNAGGASLAYAAINPAIGLGTFLAQLILRKPIAAAGTSEFHVTGRWDDPKVDEVAHKPAADASAPASAAASQNFPGVTP